MTKKEANEAVAKLKDSMTPENKSQVMAEIAKIKRETGAKKSQQKYKFNKKADKK